MGVKSTYTMTRKQAEECYVLFKMRDMEIRRKLRAEAALLSDEALEYILMKMNDEAHGGEGFENYTIVDR
jgi:hypothetical protein